MSAFETDRAFYYKYFAGEYGATVPEGFDGVTRYVEDCELDSESSIVDACGYASDDGTLTGVVRVYGDTWGIYGNYSIEKISHSLIFSYNAKNDTFSILKRMNFLNSNGCNNIETKEA